MLLIKHLNIWQSHQWVDNLVENKGRYQIEDISRLGYMLTDQYTFNGAITYEGFEVSTSDCSIFYAPEITFSNTSEIPEGAEWYTPLEMLTEIKQYANKSIQFLLKAEGRYGFLSEIKIGYHTAENPIDYILKYALTDYLEQIKFTRSVWMQSNAEGQISIPQGIAAERISKVWVREQNALAVPATLTDGVIATSKVNNIYQLIYEHTLKCEVLLSEYLQIKEIPCILIELLPPLDLYKPHYGAYICVAEGEVKQQIDEYWGADRIRVTAVGSDRSDAYYLANTILNKIAGSSRLEAFATDQLFGIQVTSGVNTTPSFDETEANLGNGFACSFDISLFLAEKFF